MPAPQRAHWQAKAVLGKQVMDAASSAKPEVAYDMYEKHLVPHAKVLERRARFDRRSQPVQVDGGVYNYDKDFYGCLPEQFGPAINAEWGESVDEWYSVTAADPAGLEPDHPRFYWEKINSYEYWLTKSCWPHLQ